MPVLITGVTGFVGSHLAQYLLSRNQKVWGTYHSGNFQNLESFRHHIRLLRCDLTDFRHILDLLRKLKPEQIYHLAATSSVGQSFSDPLGVYCVNFLGTLNWLGGARQLNLAARVLVTGSSEMYGKVGPKNLPLRETQPLNPVSPYGVSKAACDMLAYQYFLNYGLETIRVRAFNHIGPRQTLGFVIPDFVSQVAKIQLRMQEPVLTVGNLAVKRDFSDVRDIVRGYYLLMQKDNPGEAYNLASGKVFSLREILGILCQLTASKIKLKIRFSKMRVTDIPVLVGDSSKARRLTGWRPQIPIRTTLADTLEYWVNRISSSPVSKREASR